MLAGVLALIGTFVQQPAALNASDLTVAALGMQCKRRERE